MFIAGWDYLNKLIRACRVIYKLGGTLSEALLFILLFFLIIYFAIVIWWS